MMNYFKKDEFVNFHFVKYFKKGEFACPCCGEEKIIVEFIMRLDQAREYAKVPFVITSGYRCEKHNAEVGGSSESAHLKGKGSDIAATNSLARMRIIIGLLAAGFRRIGIAKNYIHVDSDQTKPSNVMWLYD